MARRRTRRSNTRRRLFWARFAHQFQAAANPGGDPLLPDIQNVLTDFEQEYGADLIGLTIVRIRGAVGIIPSGTDVRSRRVFSVGLRLVSRHEFPETNTQDEIQAKQYASDPHNDWMFGMVRQFATLPSLSNDTQNFSWSLDIKSKRRLDELGRTLMLAYGCSNELAAPEDTGGYGVWADLQVLCMRP